MKSKWPLKKLGEVCEIRPPKNEIRKRLKSTDKVSFVPMEDLGINQKWIIPNKERMLKEVEGSYTCFSNNDVLLAKITPCFENGKLGIAKDLKNAAGFGSSEFVVFRPEKDVLAEFVYYCLLCESFRREGSKRMMGAVGHKRVAKEFIDNYLIPVPSVPEQKRIVGILDETLALIDKAKENAEKNLQNAREFFESYLHSIFTKPCVEWKEKRIQDVTKVINGYSFDSKDFTSTNGIRSVKITNVGVKEFIEEESNYLPERYSNTLKGYQVKRDNIVIALTRTIISSGVKVAIVPNSYNNALLNQRVAALVPIEAVINHKYLYNYLCTDIVAKYIKAKVNTLMQPNLSINDLKNLLIPCPPLTVQQRIVAKLDTLSAETKKIEVIYRKKLSDLEELKVSILRKAFNGELTGAKQ